MVGLMRARRQILGLRMLVCLVALLLAAHYAGLLRLQSGRAKPDLEPLSGPHQEVQHPPFPLQLVEDVFEDLLQKRVDNPWDDPELKKDYTIAFDIGCQLNAWLTTSSADAPTSKWTDWNQLESYGWVRYESLKQSLIDCDIAPVEAALADLGMPMKQGEQQIGVSWQHNNPSTVSYTGSDGAEHHYQPTKAIYTTVFYRDKGVVVMCKNYSPDYRVKDTNVWEGEDRGEIVPLKKWSDVVGLEFWHLTGKVRRSIFIDYIFQCRIKRPLEKKIIFKALLDVAENEGPAEYPGTLFEIDSVGGQAILGTQTGQDVALALIEHREQLKHQTIESITVFDNKLKSKYRDSKAQWWEKSSPCLMFKIGDYKPPSAPTEA